MKTGPHADGNLDELDRQGMELTALTVESRRGTSTGPRCTAMCLHRRGRRKIEVSFRLEEVLIVVEGKNTRWRKTPPQGLVG